MIDIGGPFSVTVGGTDGALMAITGDTAFDTVYTMVFILCAVTFLIAQVIKVASRS